MLQTPADRLFSFSVGPYFLCVNAEEVVANIVPPAISRMPLTPAYALGAFFYQKEVAAAVDLRQKFELSVDTSRRSPLIISNNSANKFIAIQVDEVHDLIDGRDLSWQAIENQDADYPFLMQCSYQGQELIFSTVEKLFLFGQGELLHKQQQVGSNVVPCLGAIGEKEETISQSELSVPSHTASQGTNVIDFEQAKAQMIQVAPVVSGEVVSEPVVVPKKTGIAKPVSKPPIVYLDDGPHIVSRYWLLATVIVLLTTLAVTLYWMHDESLVLQEEKLASQIESSGHIVIETPKLRIEVLAKPESTSALSGRTPQYVHEVVVGDTLWDIAAKYLGNPYQFPELAQINGIKNPDLIYPGNVVKIYSK